MEVANIRTGISCDVADVVIGDSYCCRKPYKCITLLTRYGRVMELPYTLPLGWNFAAGLRGMGTRAHAQGNRSNPTLNGT